MSHETVRAYFNGVGLGQRVVVREQLADTVERAAEAIGCRPEHIAKTMSFLQDGRPALVVMAGDAKVNSSKYKAAFGQKAVMVPFEQVDALIGHEPGGVCPFALHPEVPVYLDVSLKRFDVIHTAGGSLSSTVTLHLHELEEHAAPSGWVDVCKGWYMDEAESPASQ